MELHLTNLVPDQLVKALCSTLIHSLWQGLILAAVAGLTIVLTKKASAALRYNLMIGLLVLFSAGVLFTFFVQLNVARQETIAAATIAPYSPLLQQAADNLVVRENQGSILTNCINYFNSHSDVIVMIWFLIICARFVQLAAGLHNIYHIKHTKVLSPGALWERRMAELVDRLGIKRSVTLLQSGIAKLPMVLGHFKPVILIPIGLLTALTTEEVEAILVHELAHIRRRDYLVNLLQNLVEIIFFFNPAVLWVSAMIKAERENCCDDIVVAQTSNKVNYIKALVSCQEYQSAIPAYAMGLGGNSDHFLQRVKRMLSNSNQTLNRVEKMVLTICLISAVLLTAAFSRDSKVVKTDIPAKPKTAKHVVLNVPSNIQMVKADGAIKTTTTTKGDTVTEGEKKIRVYKNEEVSDGSMMQFTKSDNHKAYHSLVFKKGGTLYQYIGRGSDINASGTYYINGSALSKDQVAEYLPMFEKAKIESEDRGKSLQQKLQNNGGKGEISDDADAKADIIKNQLTPSKGTLGRLGVNRTLDSMKAAADRKGLPKNKNAKLNATLASLDTLQREASDQDSKSSGGAWVKQVKAYKASKLAYDKDAKRYKAEPIEPKEPAEPGYISQAPARPAKPVVTVGDGITDQLINDHLIKDKGNYTFKITNDELYIDGVKQPDDIHKKIVDKYLKPGDKINYTRTSKTTK